MKLWNRPTSEGTKLRESNVFDFRSELKRQRRERIRSISLLVLGGLGAGVVGSLIGISWPFGTSSAGAQSNPEFAVCGTIRTTCVVDGDTIGLDGLKIRIADIDAPEISSPRCDAEYTLRIEARDRLVVLLNEGEFALESIGNRDEDRYGRKLRVIVRGGRSLGDRLVAEGLARTWTGRREPWC